jgi:hypothetical protein
MEQTGLRVALPLRASLDRLYSPIMNGEAFEKFDLIRRRWTGSTPRAPGFCRALEGCNELKPELRSAVRSLRSLVLSARQSAARGVNLLQVYTNYEIGR